MKGTGVRGFVGGREKDIADMTTAELILFARSFADSLEAVCQKQGYLPDGPKRKQAAKVIDFAEAVLNRKTKRVAFYREEEDER